MDKLTKDFRHFAIDKVNASPSVIDDKINKVNNMMTPFILEERQLNVTQINR